MNCISHWERKTLRRRRLLLTGRPATDIPGVIKCFRVAARERGPRQRVNRDKRIYLILNEAAQQQPEQPFILYIEIVGVATKNTSQGFVSFTSKRASMLFLCLRSRAGFSEKALPHWTELSRDAFFLYDAFICRKFPVDMATGENSTLRLAPAKQQMCLNGWSTHYCPVSV